MKDTLPDSRARESKGAILNNPSGLYWIPIFCANCGKEGGRVPQENMTFAFWLCDPCFERHGHIAGTLAVPDEIFWDEIREEHLHKVQKETGGK